MPLKVEEVVVGTGRLFEEELSEMFEVEGMRT